MKLLGEELVLQVQRFRLLSSEFCVDFCSHFQLYINLTVTEGIETFFHAFRLLPYYNVSNMC